MEREVANKWKLIETAILNRLWQNNTEKLLRDHFHT